MAESLLVSEIIPSSPEAIFAAWLDAEGHSAFTGSPATVEPEVGGRFTAWDGYIEGETLAFEPGRRIVQTWRTTEFPAGAPASRVEITLEPTLGGTLVSIMQTDIPEGQSESYKTGWLEFYFDPMKKYFSASDEGDGARGARRPPGRTGATAGRSPQGRAGAKAKTASGAKAGAKAKAAPRAKAGARTQAGTKAKAAPQAKLRAKGKARPKARVGGKGGGRGKGTAKAKGGAARRGKRRR